MTTNVQYVKMPTSEAMTETVNKKLNKLAEKFSWLIKAEVFFKIENDPSGKGKVCEIELSAPGPKIFASSNQNSFELAFSKTINELERQLKKRKAAFHTHV